MNFSLFSASLLATIGLTSATAFQPAGKTIPQLGPAAFAGVYGYGSGREGANGRLTIYPESDSTILFYLDLNNGKPAYSSGQLLQRAVVHGRMAVCTFNAGYSPKAGCQLRLLLQANGMLVQTVGGQNACGFGNGVSADHTYQRRSAATPAGFRDGNGKTVLFRGLTPQSYLDGEISPRDQAGGGPAGRQKLRQKLSTGKK